MLNGKKIILGVSGSIAAYKSALLIRSLVKSGAQVRVIMSPGSRDFITPLTLSTLSGNPVYADFSDPNTGEWNSHVELGLWADLMLIAPASANILAKMSSGICDNLLLATYLSARCPVYLAPAMDLDMYKHPATQANLSTLRKHGNIIIPPGVGELASGLYGEGRMAEPEEILRFLAEEVKKKAPLNGKKILVTAGPTYEAIDPVRFIGNHSSGKMGFAIAGELAAQGAEVHLITGPTSLPTPTGNIHRKDIVSAEEMHRACMSLYPKVHAAVMSAAVADFTPANKSKEKIKKGGRNEMEIALRSTIDILAEMGKKKKKGQILIGFALETEKEEAHARAKLKKKNLDHIVLNSLRDQGAGFGTDTNRVSIISADNKITKSGLKQKKDIARDIAALLLSAFNKNK